ncbi:KipI antagonist [Sporosarcina sp. NCCP-2716]|uniref:5-oxoprolinase subunit C family protein n=1 Tax=Sporosarcina sp. NCCP-2716 TaxID=2943679 RepID=UPI00203E24B1|nr:biotin-dependent carboxyltransferase family protein [Sporosarcina sp. NCCP-2716]GKV70493.1 KipI antagonist [Sporosarcina sp. NCCP-2716]
MTILVLDGGLLTTVQDLGRNGSQKFGVIVSGAMDTYSTRIANLLVGNQQDEAVLEITLVGTKLEFEKDTVISLTGADLQAKLNEETIAMWRPVTVKKGDILTCGFAIEGCRAYLALAGGVDVPVVMGSKSTYMAAGIGGFEGRPLQQGDCVSTGSCQTDTEEMINRIIHRSTPATWSVPASSLIKLHKNQTIRFLRGSEYDAFAEESRKAFITESYTLTPQSNRMGVRLEGPPVQLKEKLELLSEGVTYGTIQIPPNGKPIVLMADRQTTGGYPKIGQVITADLSSLAQCKPGDSVQFIEVTLEDAEAELLRKEKLIEEIQIGIKQKMLDT